MKAKILEAEKCNFLHILGKLNKRRANFCTISELSEHLNISNRKMIYFLNGKIFDFWLLCRYADLLGMEIEFNFK